MGQPAQTGELAPAYVFLASNADSSYITGIVLQVIGERAPAGEAPAAGAAPESLLALGPTRRDRTHSDDAAAGPYCLTPSIGPAWLISIVMKALRLGALARYSAWSAFLTSSS